MYHIPNNSRKKRTYPFIISLICIISIIIPSSGCVYLVHNNSKIALWTRTLDIDALTPSKIVADSTSVYLIGDMSIPHHPNHYKIAIMKYNMDGNLLWNHTWGNDPNTWFGDIAIDTSAIYITGGIEANISSSKSAAFLLKYDFNGNLLWNRTGIGRTGGNRIVLDSSSIYIYSYDYFEYFGGLIEFTVSLYKYDLDGNQVMNETWTKKVQGNHLMDITSTSSSTFVATYIYGNKTTRGGGFLAKYDLAGNESWNRPLNETIIGNSTFIINVNSSAIYTTSLSNHIFRYDVTVSKYDINGSFLWNQTIKNLDQGSLTIYSSAIYICGSIVGNGDGKYFIIKYTANGDFQWKKTWGKKIFYPKAEGMVVNTTGIYVITRAFLALSLTRIANK